MPQWHLVFKLNLLAFLVFGCEVKNFFQKHKISCNSEKTAYAKATNLIKSCIYAVAQRIMTTLYNIDVTETYINEHQRINSEH